MTLGAANAPMVGFLQFICGNCERRPILTCAVVAGCENEARTTGAVVATVDVVTAVLTFPVAHCTFVDVCNSNLHLAPSVNC